MSCRAGTEGQGSRPAWTAEPLALPPPKGLPSAAPHYL